MAKDDYDVLVFKILTYLYGVMQRKAFFSKEGLNKLFPEDISEEYLLDVFRLMTASELIEGLSFVKVWGNEYVLSSDLEDMTITGDGVQYLLNNSKMCKIKAAFLKAAPSAVVSLVKLVFCIP